jgi:hypothetical protein
VELQVAGVPSLFGSADSFDLLLVVPSKQLFLALD